MCVSTHRSSREASDSVELGGNGQSARCGGLQASCVRHRFLRGSQLRRSGIFVVDGEKRRPSSVGATSSMPLLRSLGGAVAFSTKISHLRGSLMGPGRALACQTLLASSPPVLCAGQHNKQFAFRHSNSAASCHRHRPAWLFHPIKGTTPIDFSVALDDEASNAVPRSNRLKPGLRTQRANPNQARFEDRKTCN